MQPLVFSCALLLLLSPPASATAVPLPTHRSNGSFGTHAGNAIPSSNQTTIPSTKPLEGQWLGWGADTYNNRRANATINSANVASLVLACQQPYDLGGYGGVSAPPLVREGVAYYTTWTGLLVALSYRDCIVEWEFNITATVLAYHEPSADILSVVAAVSRSTPVTDGTFLFVGTQLNALLLAINIHEGDLMSWLQVDSHPYAVLTQSLTLYQGQIVAGVASAEGLAPLFTPGYDCCTFVGSVVMAEMTETGLILRWKTSTIPDNPGFSGAAVSGSQPAVDPIRNQVYVCTDNLYNLPPDFKTCLNQAPAIAVVAQGLTTDPCLPPSVYQESCLALDLDSGRVNWARQMSPHVDTWNGGCSPASAPASFPEPPAESAADCNFAPGPNQGFAMAPTLVMASTSSPGSAEPVDMVIVGQKSGMMYALTAAAGWPLWERNTSPGGPEGGLLGGIAVDDGTIYYTAANSERIEYLNPWPGMAGEVIGSSAFGAVSLADGSLLWHRSAPGGDMAVAAPTVVNDVVLVATTGNDSSGAINGGRGVLYALSTATGEVLAQAALDGGVFDGIAATDRYVLLGTGNGSPREQEAGSFQVWLVEAAPEGVLPGQPNRK